MKTHPSTVAISGGLGDIGRAVAQAFTAQGYAVAIGDLNDTAPADFSGHYTKVDVCTESSVRAWFDAMEATFGGPPSVTIVNAAIVLQGTPVVNDVDDWSRTIDVNLTGAWLTAREAARRLLAVSGTGSILFVGSWVGQYPDHKIAAYCASKAGLHSLAQSMALELADQGIRVNEIAPGYVNGGLSGRIFQRNPGLAEASRQSVPVRELITCEEVARGLIFLADPANRNLTGSTLTLDGGLSLMHGPQNIGISK